MIPAVHHSVTVCPRWLQLAVLLGVALRAFHYLRNPSVWHDEAAMIVNILRLPIGHVFGPLHFDEAAPPLFLLFEQAAVALSGDGQLALRLLPFLASVLSLLLMADVAQKLLPVPWSALAVLLVAVSDRLLWHACEAKAYSVDVLVAVLVPVLLLRTAQWTFSARCLLLAVCSPVLIWVSFPACFVCGGALVALLPGVRRGRWRERLTYVTVSAVVLGSFALLYFGPIQAQRTDAMSACWVNEFPNLRQPLELPIWTLFKSFELVRYCFVPLGQPLLILVIIGVWAKLRPHPQRAIWVALLLPIVLAFVAALLGKYPYGPARVLAYTAPAFALLALAGLQQLVMWFGSKPKLRWALWFWAWVFIVPCAYTAYRLFDHWPRAECDVATQSILAHRQPNDAIHCNHWEGEYYFRHVESSRLRISHAYNPDEGWEEWSASQAAGVPPPRIWVLHVQFPLPPGSPYVLPPGYHLAETHLFQQIRIELYEPDIP